MTNTPENQQEIDKLQGMVMALQAALDTEQDEHKETIRQGVDRLNEVAMLFKAAVSEMANLVMHLDQMQASQMIGIPDQTIPPFEADDYAEFDESFLDEIEVRHEVQTLLHPVNLDIDEADAELADMLDEGWEIRDITFLPPYTTTQFVLPQRVITLIRLSQNGSGDVERVPESMDAPELDAEADPPKAITPEFKLTNDYVKECLDAAPDREAIEIEPEPVPVLAEDEGEAAS